MATINVSDYGAVGNATHYNPSTCTYHPDTQFASTPNDDTPAFRSALSSAIAGDEVLFDGNKRYMIKGSLVIPSGVKFGCVDGTLGKLWVGNGFNLSNFYFRKTETRTGNVKSIIATAENSKDIVFKNFELEGNRNTVIYDDWGLAGILAQKTKNVKFENVHVNWINIRENLQTLFEGWSITTIDTDGIEIYNCSGAYSGYQIFGFFDRSSNGVMKNCVSGLGWRTSVQVHRDCSDIQILDCRIIQQDNAFETEPHAAVTFHGEEGEEVRNILLKGCYIESGYGFKAAVQAFRQSENVTIVDNEIKSNGEGIHVGDASGAIVERNKITALPNDKKLDRGRIGVNVVGGTHDSIIRYNEISGFDKTIGTDTSIHNNVINSNGKREGTIQKVKLVRNVGGVITEGFAVQKVDGKPQQCEVAIRSDVWV